MIPGDHIYYFCWPHYHHGIYCGDIFYNNKTYKNVVIHFEGKNRRGQIRGIDYNKFAQGREIEIMEYGRGSCYLSKSVVQRAISRLGESGYDLLWNNCEHFAHWCKTGRTASGQVNNVISMTGKVGSGLLGMTATGACLPLVPLAIPGAIGIGAVVAAGCAVGHLVGELVTESFTDSVDY